MQYVRRLSDGAAYTAAILSTAALVSFRLM